MLRRNQRPLSLTERQSQQLKDTNASLRKLNRASLRQLQRVGYSDLTDTQYSEAGNSLGIVAIRMNSVPRFREQIMTYAREQEPGLFQLVLGGYCKSCQNKPYPLTGPNSHQAEQECLRQDPAWQTEIDCLLEVVHRTEERVFGRCMSRGTLPKSFFTALARLTSTLLRQRRDMQKMAPEQGRGIEIRQNFETCVVCGRSVELYGEKEDPIECSDEACSEVAPETCL